MTTLLRVPLINTNEDEVMMAEVCVREGDAVRPGDVVCVVETTKATVDVEAPGSGFVRELRVLKGRSYKVGALICAFSSTPDEVVALPEQEPAAVESTPFRATRKARELAERHQVNLESLKIPGIITEKEVQRFLAAHSKVPAQSGARAAARWTPPPELGSGKHKWVVIYGAGGHARSVIDILREGKSDLRIAAAVDDSPDAPAEVLGIPVIGTSGELGNLRQQGVECAVLGIGSIRNHARRKELYEKLLSQGFMVPNLIHPRAAVEPSATMGVGNQIFAGAILGSAVKLGDDTIINSGTVVSHDCRIGSHSHLSPGAILAGGVTVGENTLVGMGVTVYQGVRIGANVILANGTHVFHDVLDGSVVRSGRIRVR